ncbi:MAG: transporter substrate-binding domain-containing protein [Defluviicoccus sp.]|nr:transporter substrate-binding domain-containing protein [Defluviicoccus sp.]MDE0274348.1 transporter substrate-binding domain-containing protein [Defluviicoccus sp.]
MLRPTIFASITLLSLGLATAGASAEGCPKVDRKLSFGFYAHFEPVSHSAADRPGAPGFDTHLGYEADLLSALEAIEGANLSFSRKGIAEWAGIWQLPAAGWFDVVGGGITILETRTRDSAGKTTIVFTSGHIAFRHSLLVRAEHTRRLARYGDLTGADRVGVVRGTTGEARLLELTGIANAAGVLAAGTRVETPDGPVPADGSAAYVINAAGVSPMLTGRRQLRPASAAMPRVMYYSEEPALIEALVSGRIDAVAKDEIGNRADAAAHRGTLVVTAVDSRAEAGGFAFAAKDAPLAACFDRHIARLTDGGRIGFRDWLDDRQVFMRRASQFGRR